MMGDDLCWLLTFELVAALIVPPLFALMLLDFWLVELFESIDSEDVVLPVERIDAFGGVAFRSKELLRELCW
jgi:hypothetical protein